MFRAVPAISLGGFLFIVIAFFLPFVRVDCGDGPVAVYSGDQLVTGVKARVTQEGDADATARQHDLKPSWFATAAFAIAVAGCISSLPRGNRATVARMALGGGGVVSMLLLMVDGRLRSAGVEEAVVTAVFLWPAWAVTAAFGVVLCLNAAARAGSSRETGG